MNNRATRLLVAALFLNPATVVSIAVAAAGDLDLSFSPGSGMNGTVYSVAVQADGKVFVGGTFTTVNGTTRNGIARLNADGSLDATFDPGTGVAGSHLPGVYSIAVQPDGKVVIGGDFEMVDGASHFEVARLNANGSVDKGFGPGVPDIVYSVALQPDGKILIGGRSRFILSSGGTLVWRLNPDGSLDSSFHATLRPDEDVIEKVHSLAPQSDGKILVGGWFFAINGTSRRGIARLNVDGSLDDGFNPAIGGAVNSVAALPDSKVLIGGDLSSVDGARLNGIARLNGDGSLDAGFNPDVGLLSGISPMAVQTDGKVLIAGCFKHVSRLNPDGSVDADFWPRSLGYAGFGCSCCPAHAPVLAISVQPDGKALIGGEFTTVGSVSRRGVARLLGAGPPNHPPVADASGTKLFWVTSNGSNALVTLDGSRSYDPDGDPLQYTWYGFEQVSPATGVVVVVTLSVGVYPILLEVSDGALFDNDFRRIEVITATQAIERLIAALDTNATRPQPLQATLAAATASINRSKSGAAVNQLRAFQRQVRVQIPAFDTALVESLIRAAQEVIDALVAGEAG